jgi:opacity protein-like surface antigen
MKRWTMATWAFCGLLGACGTSAFADGGGFGVGAGIVSRVNCDGCKTPLWLTANLRVKLNRNFALEPEAGWYREKEDILGVDITQNAFNFGGSALVLIPSEQVEIFAGGGAGAHMFRLSGAGDSTTDTKLGIHFLGGLDLKVSDSMSLFGAIRYEMINVSDETDLGDADDWAKQWKFYGGIRLVTP